VTLVAPECLRVADPAVTSKRKVAAVFAGIDTHKDTLAVAVIDDAGHLLAARDVPNTEQGFVQLVGLFETHQVVRVGIEGSGHFGRAVAVHLLLGWQPARSVAVVEVPTLMTSRERRGQLGKAKPTQLMRWRSPGSPHVNPNCRRSG
jgi:Transposase